MNENSNPVYKSEYKMTKEMFYDFYNTAYRKMSIIFSVFFVLISCAAILNLIAGNYQMISITLIEAFLLCVVYIRTGRSVNLGYNRRSFLSEGDDEFCDKFYDDMVATKNEEKTREYPYTEITKFLETKELILLMLRHNLCIAVSKKGLDTDEQTFKAFLLEKCVNVKKKKFVSCKNSKKLALILLILNLVFSAVCTAAAIVLYLR